MQLLSGKSVCGFLQHKPKQNAATIQIKTNRRSSLLNECLQCFSDKGFSVSGIFYLKPQFNFARIVQRISHAPLDFNYVLRQYIAPFARPMAHKLPGPNEAPPAKRARRPPSPTRPSTLPTAPAPAPGAKSASQCLVAFVIKNNHHTLLEVVQQEQNYLRHSCHLGFSGLTNI